MNWNNFKKWLHRHNEEETSNQPQGHQVNINRNDDEEPDDRGFIPRILGAWGDWLDNRYTDKQQYIGASVIGLLLIGSIGFSFWFFSPSQRLARSAGAVQSALKKQTMKDDPSGHYSYSGSSWTPSMADLLQYRKQYGGKVTLRGQVSVPSVHIAVPVYEGVSDGTLAWGAGTSKPGQLMGEGNYAIQGHNYRKLTAAANWFFSGLQNQVAPTNYVSLKYVNVKNGAKVYGVDKHAVYTYQVFRSDIVDTRNPGSSEALMDTWTRNSEVGKAKKYAGIPVMTLATCYEQEGILHPEQRLIVTSRLVKKQSLKGFEATHDMHKIFKPAKNLF